MASIELFFANGTRLEAEYWRLVVDGKAGISSFDHEQKYGLPAPIDAVVTLREAIQNNLVTNAILDVQLATYTLSLLEKSPYRCSTSRAMKFGTSTSPTAPESTPTTPSDDRG